MHNRLSLWLAAVVFVSDAAVVSAQAVAAPVQPTVEQQASALAEKLKAIEERDKTFRFGLSVGWRHIISSDSALRRDAAIEPATGKVVVDKVDQGDVVLSAVAVAFPWKKALEQKASGPWRLGFIANVDLASFGSESMGGFNKSIEGGGGLALKLSDGFSLAMTIERVFSRQLKSFVKTGEPLKDAEGKAVTTLVKSDDRFFKNDNITALSLKFVYFIR